MKTKEYKELVDVHLQHRIWRNELEMAMIEIDFWEEILEKQKKEAGEEPVPGEADIMSYLHRYQRLSQELLAELQQQDKQVADGVKNNRVLSPPTMDDHKYLREHMDTFRADFREFKDKVRHFVIAQPSI